MVLGSVAELERLPPPAPPFMKSVYRLNKESARAELPEHDDRRIVEADRTVGRGLETMDRRGEN
jgi:hypothetical protein